MKSYFSFIDSLKGLAIILVVMGHIIAWNYNDFSVIIDNGEKTDAIWWRVIYSFHMPLFFWLSGFLIPYNFRSFHDLLIIIWKRSYTLLIPYICAGLIYHIVVGGSISNYWFLMNMFELQVFFLFYEFLKTKLNLGIITDAISYIIIFVLFKLAILTFKDTSCGNILCLNHINNQNFIGFIFGIVCGRYEVIMKVIDKNLFYTVCLIVFVILQFCALNNLLLEPYNNAELLLPFCGIVCLVYLFKIHIMSRFIGKIFTYLGRHSLEIYILHFYFCIRVCAIGNYSLNLIHSSNLRDVVWGHFSILLFTIIEASVVIGFSIGLMTIIRASDFLSVAILGRKNNMLNNS